MKINLRNSTIFSKILSGFILVLVMAIFIWGILFLSLDRVSKMLSHMIEHEGALIVHSTEVERYALRAIINEKKYLLFGKKEIYQQAMKDIQAIYDNLDKIDEAAIKYNNQDVLQKARNARYAVEKYQSYYNQGVALLEKNQLLASKMRTLGAKVNELSYVHMVQHKELWEKAIIEGIDQQKYIDSFLLCIEAEKEALEMRRQEKNYILYKEQKYFDKLKEHIASLLKLYVKISEVAYVFEHQTLLIEARKATEEYLVSAEKWMANDNEMRNILEKMHEIGINIQDTALFVQDAGWLQMEYYQNLIVMTTKKSLLISALLGSVALILGFLGAFFISMGIARPIKELTQASNKISENDFNIRVKVKSKDEIGSLANAFNKMSENLKERIKKEKRLVEIAEIAAGAEKRRVAELEKAYKDLKEAQDMLVQAEKLSAIGQLASGVAHEVRNPLGIILQGVDYLDKKISPKERDISETLVMLKDSVERADKIINALLDFSKATKQALYPEDINSILDNSLTLVKTMFKFENINVIVEAKKDIPKVLVDKNKIEQVFINVFLNAIQAMPRGGKIFVRSFDKHLEEARNGIVNGKEKYFQFNEKVVIVEIEDTGSGITEENLKKIFDPFFTTKASKAGAGLGLSVCQNIIATHRACIDIKSLVGRGTKVTITFKIAKE